MDIDPAVSRHQKKGKLNTKHESRLWRSDERVSRQRARVGRDVAAGQPYIDADNDSIRASFKAKSIFKRRLSLFVATYRRVHCADYDDFYIR